MTRLERRLRLAIYVLASGLIAGAFLGGWLNYNPFPFFDGWDGNINFQIMFEDRPSVLLAQHNEHRLIITRLLVLLDYNLFGGRHIFLTLTNYMFALVAWYAFWHCLKLINQDDVEQRDVNLLAMVIGGWVFLWSQEPNFVWGFQNQVHAAQVFPLLAFLSLSHAARRPRDENRLFITSLALGVVSAGSMANGALALPLMAVWSIFLRMRFWQTLSLVGAGALVLFLYTRAYFTPPGHSSVFSTFFEHPFSVLLFTFKFLGNPFVHVISPLWPANWLALALGVMLAGTAAFLTVQLAKYGTRSAAAPGLTLYIVYVGSTAFLTAGGRIFFDEYMAYIQRYTTPTVLAWAAFTCLISPWIFRVFYSSRNSRRGVLIFAVVGLAACFIPLIRNVVPSSDFHHNQAMAALAAELGIPDEEQIGHTYPSAKAVIHIADRARARDLGVFGRSPYRGLRETIGESWTSFSGSVLCRHETLEELKVEAADHVRVSGTVFVTEKADARSRVLMVNADNKVVGAGLTRRPQDRRTQTGARVRIAEFTAYVPDGLTGFRIASEACQ
ncbi:MAG: hypothetical protein AAGL11_04170 [Pseudomonadota bacterium]